MTAVSLVSGLSLADFVDSPAILHVQAPGLRPMLWAGRLASDAGVRSALRDAEVLWWADELAEVLALDVGARGSDLLGDLDAVPEALAALERVKVAMDGDGEIELSEAAMALLFGSAPPLAKWEVEALWAAWPAETKAAYRARRKWALRRVPDDSAHRLMVARYAAWRCGVAGC